MEKEFISWIPCVSGDLFFSKTAHALGSYDFYLTNTTVRDDDGVFKARSLLASSVVDWQDTDLLSELNRGLYRVVVDAYSTEYTSLSGSVYLLEKNNGDLTNGSTIQKILPRKSCNRESAVLEQLHILRKNYVSHGVVLQNSREHQELDQSRQKIKDALDSISSTVVHKIDFEIHQTGMMLSIAAYTKAQGEVVLKNYHERRRLCGQAFYYLKFLLHKHIHHSNENETLTTVHRLKNQSIDNAQILIRDLKRGLVDVKRARRSTGHTASGIAVYGASLVKSCESLGWFDPDHILPSKTIAAFSLKRNADHEIDYLQNVGNSLELINEEQLKERTKSAKSSFMKTYTVSVLWLLGVIGPILVYINIFTNGYFSAIRVEDSGLSRVKIKGDLIDQLTTINGQQCQILWPGLRHLCELGTSTLIKYASGQLGSAVAIVLFVLFVSIVPAALATKWGRFNLSKWCSDFNQKYIAKAAYSLNGKRSWQYFFIILILLIKKIFIAMYQPKISGALKLQWIALCLGSAIAFITIYLGLTTVFTFLF